MEKLVLHLGRSPFLLASCDSNSDFLPAPWWYSVTPHQLSAFTEIRDPFRCTQPGPT